MQALLRTIAVAGALSLAGVAPRPAHAFEYGSAITTPCHERMTAAALRAARVDRPAGRPIATTADERALVDDVQFDLDEDMHDLGGVSLLLGVRDNDLKGRGGTEVDQLAIVHGDPALQREHCLRPPDAHEPGGSDRALRECRAFVLEKMGEALDGLDAAGNPDPSKRMLLDVQLDLRGSVEASLPIFYVRLGQAMHTLQDGFSHTYRTSDGSKVTVVLDWIHFVEKDHEERRHGPAHQRALDQCDDSDALLARNRRLATEASTELARIALQPNATREAKLAQVDALLARHLSYAPGCTADNRWCDAPENRFADEAGCGCNVAGARRDAAAAGLAAIAIAAAVLRRKRRGAAVAVILLATVDQDSEPPPVDPAATPAPPVVPAPPVAPVPPVTAVEEEQVLKEAVHTASPFAIAAGFGGSVVDPGMAAHGGMRLRLSDHVVIGLDGEVNWWYGVQTSTLRTGAVNVYGSFIARFPLRFSPVNLRTTAQLGTAIQTLDLYGVPSGSVGIFGALYPLGIEWKLSRAFYLVAQPLGVAVPVPKLTGAPFAYPQFRTSVGLELAL